MAKLDPLAKRPNETDQQWKLRLALVELMRTPPGEPLVPMEAQGHGHYVEGFVTHVETNTKAKTLRNRSVSSLEQMHRNGSLTAQQYGSAIQIAGVAEAIERAVSVRCASLEARVDNAGGKRDHVFEALHRVRLEVAYSLWRRRLPRPGRMLVDMVIADRSLASIARTYHIGWPRAQAMLRDALDLWADLFRIVVREVDEREVAVFEDRLRSACQVYRCA